MIEQNDKLPNGSRSLLNIAILFQEWVGIKFQNSFKMVLPRIESNLLLNQNQNIVHTSQEGDLYPYERTWNYIWKF